MRAGQLRHLVTIEKVTETRSGADVVETWSTHTEQWAQVRPLTGRELFTSQQRWAEVDTQIVMRGNPETRGITSKMRVVLNDTLANPPTSKIFNILAVMDIEERGVQINLMCRKEGQ